MTRLRGRRPRGDDGNAMLEFAFLGVVLMVPLIYLVLYAFLVQRAAFAVSAAAREAGRAYVTSPTALQAERRGDYAARLALTDQGLDAGAAAPTYTGDGLGLRPGGTVEVRVTYQVELPVLGSIFGGGSIPVTGVHLATVDEFRAPR